ncbi:syndecan-2-B-like [Brachyhypopomus gauderio]|uniref:syndecan-2-B-like n=1 Tax=Brachyhypopomus gauderio TaxID=698409 RepID=UPI004041FE7B
MRNIWMLFSLAALCFSGEKSAVTGQTVPIDVLYLENHSGDYPVDDDDFSSGSGSGFSDSDDEDMLIRKNSLEPSIQILETPFVREEEATVGTILEGDLDTEVLDYVTEEPQVSVEVISTSSSPGLAKDYDKHHEVHTENLFERKEVLAAVIAGGVIGFLFAIFLILLLVYRMRKKDEGSYDLGERKPPSTAYQKAPTKEFYA